MILNFIFSHLNAIVLGVWILFLAVVAIRFFQPTKSNLQHKCILNKCVSKLGVQVKKIKFLKPILEGINKFFSPICKSLHLNSFVSKIVRWIKKISYTKLILVAIGLNIFYGVFVTWGQYYTWSTLSDVTRFLLTAPLPTQVPFPSYLEWTRPLFANHLGYFMFYVWGRVWLDIFILFTFSGLLYFVFKTWKFYRGGFLEKGPELMLVLMLISGWTSVLVSLSLGFIFAILWVGYSLFRGKKNVAVEPVFIFATFFALIFAKIILAYF